MQQEFWPKTKYDPLSVLPGTVHRRPPLSPGLNEDHVPLSKVQDMTGLAQKIVPLTLITVSETLSTPPQLYQVTPVRPGWSG
jgi:hypothetical protein